MRSSSPRGVPFIGDTVCSGDPTPNAAVSTPEQESRF